MCQRKVPSAITSCLLRLNPVKRNERYCLMKVRTIHSQKTFPIVILKVNVQFKCR